MSRAIKKVTVANGLYRCDVIIADTLWLKMRGLLFRYDWKGGMLIPTRSIHTFLMHQSLDIYYLDREGKVIKALMDFPPNRISPIVRDAVMVLEVPVGALGNMLPGNKLYIDNHIETGGFLDDKIFV